MPAKVELGFESIFEGETFKKASDFKADGEECFAGCFDPDPGCDVCYDPDPGCEICYDPDPGCDVCFDP